MLLDLTIKDLIAGLNARHFSTAEIIDEAYQTAKMAQKTCNAFITLIPQEEINQKIKNLTAEPLAGIPYVMKDSYLTKDIRTTAASKILETFIPPYNATVYEKLISSGAVLIGKMNMDAWGHGASTENTDFGPTKNPWDRSRVAGGSSGGPAAALAARACSFAIGEDTGGSIRQPASWCNLTGLRVTYGRVSRYGCIAYASSLDTVGPMAKTAEDCGLILDQIAGLDPYDATTSHQPVENYAAQLNRSVAGLTLGIPDELFTNDLDEEIKKTIETAIKELEKLGLKTKKISLPLLRYGVPLYYILAPSETSSNLARYDGVRYGHDRRYFTKETERRLMIGTYALSAGYYDAYYVRAQKVRTRFINDYVEAFKNCDVIITPVSPTLPAKLNELLTDPVKNMLADYFMTTVSCAGLPGLAIPAGFSKTDLPIGLQLVGPMFSEGRLLNIGHQYQQVTNWHLRKPNL